MNNIASIKDIADYLIKQGNNLKPVRDLDIKFLEETFKVSLPEVYVQFLKRMGQSAGNYMLGSSVFYDEIFFLRQWADELFIENKLEPTPEDAFVFWMHQGYQVAFFYLNSGNNPPVYYFSESQDEARVIQKENCLIDFFIAQLAFIN